ncbi:MAG: histidine phosphatase family protein [Chloroflexi bacterium]|jgi:phosphohistidine phosphatase|nr:histidine phosphatase family protein [Chloroflexota bacterium]
MKTLILMRHAKSSWKHPELADLDRPLNKRGNRDAPMMGQLIEEKELTPQLILSSNAVRAKETVRLFTEADHFNGEVRYLENFYMAESQAYLEGLRTLPDNIERVMVVGHNPGLEGLLQILSGQVASLPTAAIAHIALPIQHWNELNDSTTGELVDFWRPHDLKKKK